MSLLNPLLEFNTPKLGEEYYHAVVVNNNDELKLNRIQIRILELHGTEQELPNEVLPWAIQFRPTFLGGGTNLSLSSVPRVGSDVIVTHIRGDIYQPAYIFELMHQDDKIEQAQQNYPNSYVLRDSNQNYWHVDLVNDKLDIKFNGSETLNITVDRYTIIGQNENNSVLGSRVETIGSDLTQTVQNNKTVNATKLVINTTANVEINAGGDCKVVAGGNITLEGSGGGALAGIINGLSINELTGLPFADPSTNVKCTKG